MHAYMPRTCQRTCSSITQVGLVGVGVSSECAVGSIGYMWACVAGRNCVLGTGSALLCLQVAGCQHLSPQQQTKLWLTMCTCTPVLLLSCHAPVFVLQQPADIETLHVLEGDHPDHQEQLLGTRLGQHQQQQAQQLAALQALHAAQPSLSFSTAFLEGTLNRCRATKTAAELGCLLAASQGSAAAHKALWGACQPGVFEYQLEAAFVHECLRYGNMQLG